MLKHLVVIFGLLTVVNSNEVGIDEIQIYNVNSLKRALPSGWRYFCDAEVDEAVMHFYPGSAVADGTVTIRKDENESETFPIREMYNLKTAIDPAKKTVVFVTAFVSGTLYDIRGNLEIFQNSRKDLNIVVVDFAQNILQLYNSVKHNAYIQAYFVSKLIDQLVAWGGDPKDIVLAGHSVGANVAALGAELYSQEEDGKLPLLVAIDPATMCQREDIYVNSTSCERVVVIHGENDVFSVREAIGTIDIYPNGDALKHQPGCTSNLCSHMYSLLVFMESVIEESDIVAVKCDDWNAFRRGKCDFEDVVKIGLEYDEKAEGKYFCLTAGSHPYSMEKAGLRCKK